MSKGKDNTKYWYDYDYAVKNIANGKPVILGEVGWPSAGKPDQGAAISSVENHGYDQRRQGWANRIELSLRGL